MTSGRICRAVLALLSLVLLGAPQSGLTQTPPATSAPRIGQGVKQEPIQKNEPVTFTADHVDYDRDSGLVTASGHVEAWQNDHVLRADKIVYDRNTNVVAASGHVVLLEPDGEVLFSDYAELTQGMREGVLSGMRALLAQNGRLVANGARRSDGEYNELSRVVYSVCNLCKEDPTKPPLWQIRAYTAVQDLQAKRLEFQDAVLEFDGIPVFYAPYFSTTDPSVKRQSGFLGPEAGNESFLGSFIALPYYWVIDKSSDLTITPWVDTLLKPQVDTLYREKFNDGEMVLHNAFAYDLGGLQAYTLDNGTFAINDQWRWGFSLNYTSNENYVRDFMLPGFGNEFFANSVYLEGFGQGSYSRLDTQFYQGLLNIVNNKELPYVLPRYTYSYVGQPDQLGGVFSFDGTTFNVFRLQGTDDQQAMGSVNYDLPEIGRYGDIWHFMLHVDSVAANAYNMNLIPNYASFLNSQAVQAMPTAAVRVNWPLVRNAKDGSSVLLEPITQVLLRPRAQSGIAQTVIPNEDSLDQWLFSDANLFAFNRFPGLDRLGGGPRADVAMHFAWNDGIKVVDGLIGQSYRTSPEPTLWPRGTGLGGTVSDVVGRLYVAPVDWFDFTYRTRLSHDNFATSFADAVADVGPQKLKFSFGYIYSNVNPFYVLDVPPGVQPVAPLYQPRDEATVGLSTKYGPWSLSGSVRRNLQANEMVSFIGNAAYENECVIVALSFFELFTNYNGFSNINGGTISLTLKTLGQFGVPAAL